MNRTTLLGRVGQEPEIKRFDNGVVCKFSLATSESYKNKQGEKVTDTEWHNLVFWGKQCDVLEKWVHKGDQLFVEGKIKTRTYDDKNGVKHYATEIICDKFEFIGGKKESKPDNKEGQYRKGDKVHVDSMSNADDLPIHVQEQQDASSNDFLPS